MRTRCGARATHSAGGVLLVNGDTVHPRRSRRALLAARGAEVLIAVDQEKLVGGRGDEGPSRR